MRSGRWPCGPASSALLAVDRKTIREVVIEGGHVDGGKLTTEQLDAALDVLAMARGGK